MSVNVQKVLRQTRRDLAACFKETRPSNQFGATITLAMVGLYMTAGRIRKTRNLKERRQLLNEFNKRKRAIKKGILLLRDSAPEGNQFSEQKRHSMS